MTSDRCPPMSATNAHAKKPARRTHPAATSHWLGETVNDPSFVKLAFHDADTGIDTDTDILARK